MPLHHSLSMHNSATVSVPQMLPNAAAAASVMRRAVRCLRAAHKPRRWLQLRGCSTQHLGLRSAVATWPRGCSPVCCVRPPAALSNTGCSVLWPRLEDEDLNVAPARVCGHKAALNVLGHLVVVRLDGAANQSQASSNLRQDKPQGQGDQDGPKVMRQDDWVRLTERGNCVSG